MFKVLYDQMSNLDGVDLNHFSSQITDVILGRRSFYHDPDFKKHDIEWDELYHYIAGSMHGNLDTAISFANKIFPNVWIKMEHRSHPDTGQKCCMAGLEIKTFPWYSGEYDKTFSLALVKCVIMTMLLIEKHPPIEVSASRQY